MEQNIKPSFLKCLWQRKVMILLLAFVISALASLVVYVFYNPAHEYYSVTFRTNDVVDTSLYTSKSYIRECKNKIQDIRENGKYIITDEFRYKIDASDSYTFDKDAELITITHSDSSKTKVYGILEDDYILDGIRYLELDEYWVYINGGNLEYSKKNHTISLTDTSNNTKTYYAKWDGVYKYSYSSFSYVNVADVAESTKIKKLDENTYKLSVLQREFNTWQQARRFLKRMVADSTTVENKTVTDSGYVLGDSLVFNDTAKDLNKSIVSENGGVNIYLFTVVGLGAGLLISLLIVSILFLILKDDFIDKMEYDNESVYKTPFHKKYWKDAIEPFKDIKSVTFISVLIAMVVVCKLIHLPSGFGTLGIGLGYLFFAIACLLYGPVVGSIFGMITNTLGFFLFPTGYPFHIGYTFTTALTGFFYGVLFYKTKVTFSKVFISRILVNLLINAFLSSIWWGQISDFNWNQTVTYMLTISLPKNLAYLVPQSVLLFIVFKALSRVFVPLNLVDPRICKQMTIF